MEEKGEVIQVLSWLCVRHFMAITQDHCRLRAQPPFSNQTRASSSSTSSHNTLIISSTFKYAHLFLQEGPSGHLNGVSI